MSAPASRPLRLAFAGGGTGGHIVPGLHLLDAARDAGVEVEDLVWFTSGRAVEERVLAELERRAEGVPCERVALDLEPPGGGAPSLARTAVRAAPNVARARRALREHGSEVLLALGGFTSLPAALAAKSLRIPFALLEINAARGRATRCLAPLAARVFHAWSASAPPRPAAKHARTGPPLPPELFRAARTFEGDAEARAAWGFGRDAALVLVLGGSQGAASLNRFVARCVDELRSRGAQVLHQTGPGRLSEGAEEAAGYRRVEYVDDVASALRAATLVVCRGGASSLAELAALGVPAVVVPYPHHPDRHQERNARELGTGVRIVRDEELGPELARELARLASEEGEAERARMSEALRRALPADAGRRILAELAALRSSRPRRTAHESVERDGLGRARARPR